MGVKPDYKNQYRHLTLADMALEKAAQKPDQIAVYLEDGNHISFGSIVDEGKRLAVALSGLGVSQGDVASFQLPNWREAIASISRLRCWAW